MKHWILFALAFASINLFVACHSHEDGEGHHHGEEQNNEEHHDHDHDGHEQAEVEIDHESLGMDVNGQLPEGLEVGEQAPDFSSKDQYGNEVSLEGMLENGPVILFFYRGYWCPFCTKYLDELMQHKADIEELGGQLVAVTPEDMEGAMKSVEAAGVDFTIISNPELDILKSYEVDFTVTDAYQDKIITKLEANIQENNGGGDDVVLPVPATYVIGQDGEIKYAYFDYNYRERAPVEEIIEVLR